MPRPSSIFAFLLLLPSWSLAQPADLSRVLRTFDFEERQLGNMEDLPMHWNKIEGPGLPHYVNGHLATARARSGRYSFQFDLNGGSLVYRYAPGLIRVQLNSYYSVQAYVQTTALDNARARISAYLTDEDGHPLLSTLRKSEPFSSPGNDDTWHPLSVQIPCDDPKAAYLVIELGLLQPEHWMTTTLGQRALFTQDIHGSAWFDDVTVSQVPQVAMTTQRPGNVFRRSDPLALTVQVNDRFTDDLAAQLIVRNASGEIIYQKSGALDPATAQQKGAGIHCFPLLLPETISTGWYQATLEMTSHGKLLGQQTLNFVRLNDDVLAAAPDDRFGVNAADLPFAGWNSLPTLLPMLGAGRVKLAVWSKTTDIQDADADAFNHLLSALTQKQITPTACLVDLPPSVTRNLAGHTEWTRLLTADPNAWQPQMAYLISRHADHLPRWQLGADGSDAFVTDPQMRRVYKLVYSQFAKLMDAPDLAMPWPAWYELEGDLPATVALHVKPDILPSQLPLYIQDERDHMAGPTGSASSAAQHNLSVYLEPLDAAKYGREVQIRDLAQRFVYAMSADAKRIDLKLPFTVEKVGDQLMEKPDELLLVARTLMTTLSGATFKGKVPIATGVEAFLFERDGRGIMMLWDRAEVTSKPKLRQLALNLGEKPLAVDLWGNVTPLLQAGASGEGDANGVQLQVGPMPTFLLDIDAELAQLRASVGVDDPRLESTFKSHTRKIHFTNPYKTAISGMVRLRAPLNWTLNPPSFAFNLNPGETFDKEVTIDFPYNSVAGNKIIKADFNLPGGRNGSFTVPITLKLGLSDVGLQSLALRDGNDVIVQQMITNYGEKPINYTAFAVYPGQARQERLVSRLAAGKTTIKKYRFTNITIDNSSKVRSGIKENEGVRILNDEVAIQ